VSSTPPTILIYGRDVAITVYKSTPAAMKTARASHADVPLGSPHGRHVAAHDILRSTDEAKRTDMLHLTEHVHGARTIAPILPSGQSCAHRRCGGVSNKAARGAAIRGHAREIIHRRHQAQQHHAPARERRANHRFGIAWWPTREISRIEGSREARYMSTMPSPVDDSLNRSDLYSRVRMYELMTENPAVQGGIANIASIGSPPASHHTLRPEISEELEET